MSGRRQRTPWRPPSAPRLPPSRFAQSRELRILQQNLNAHVPAGSNTFFGELTHLRQTWRNINAIYAELQRINNEYPNLPRGRAPRTREYRRLVNQLNQEMGNADAHQQNLDNFYQHFQQLQSIANASNQHQGINEFGQRVNLPYRRALYFHRDPEMNATLPDAFRRTRADFINEAAQNDIDTQDHLRQWMRRQNNPNLSAAVPVQTSLAPQNWYQDILLQAQNPPEWNDDNFSGQPPAA